MDNDIQRTAPGLPPRSLSETIVDFGTPLLGGVAPEVSLEVVKTACTVVITAWNVHVMAMPVWSQPEHRQELESIVLADQAPPDIRETYEVLTARRLALFADDPRAVGQWRVVMDPQHGFALQCETCLPDNWGQVTGPTQQTDAV